MVKTFGFDNDKVVFILLIKIVIVQVIFSTIYISKMSLKKMFLRIFWNVIKAGTGACASNIILKIHYKSFSIYLAIDKAREKVFQIRIWLPNNTRGSKSLLRSLSKKVDLEKVEPSRPNVELNL